MDTTVAIVGAGPAGLVAAHMLQQAGVPFVVLERGTRADLDAGTKAGAVEYRTVELLRSAGIVDRVVTFDVTNGRCEFRTPTDRSIIDYGALTGGRAHYVFSQHLLVGALADALGATGQPVQFCMAVREVRQAADGVELVAIDEHGANQTIAADIVLGCDGSRSVVAAAMRGVDVCEETTPVRLLAVLGATPPMEGHTIYGAHPRGYAGQMRRGPDVTRFYLEVPGSDALADWPGHRIGEELSIRLQAPQLATVTYFEPSLVDLRMRMTTPMQDGRLYLAGDAAHLITPAGGKGMNLAIHDAVELARGVVERYGPHANPARLEGYTAARLPDIWRVQAFSRWMLRLMMSGSDQRGAESELAFASGLKQGWVAALRTDPLLARWFAHAYAGVNPTP